jgi:uncharacterized membrane protein
MTYPKPFSARRHEVSRVEGFSDAVFAFAVTLLVVSLEVPRTFDELSLAMRDFFAFGICFTLLFQVWWRHFNFFRRYGLEDPQTIALTGVLLFVVLFYVYPMKFQMKWLVDAMFFNSGNRVVGPDGHAEEIVRGSQAVRLMQIYSLGLVAVFGVFALLHLHAYRRRVELHLREDEILTTRMSVIDNVGFVLIGLLSAAIATFGGRRMTSVAGLIYFLIGPMKFWLGSYTAKQHRRLATRNAQPAERGD